MHWCSLNVVLSSRLTLVGTMGVANFLEYGISRQLQSHRGAQETHSILVARGRSAASQQHGANREEYRRTENAA
jgi:hypothetical protein